jgi:hypothetical protein
MYVCVHSLHYDCLPMYAHLVSYAHMSILLISILELLLPCLPMKNINKNTLIILLGEMLQGWIHEVADNLYKCYDLSVDILEYCC